MQIRADDLVRAAMTAGGVKTSRELARKLDLIGYDSPKRVERWLRGENKPRYDETIALLQLAGWLREDRAAAGLAEAKAALADAEEAERRMRDVGEEPPRDAQEPG